MPMDRRLYHRDWKSISRQIREQADNRCEFCGAPNHTWIQRNTSGEWMLEDELAGWQSDAGWAWIGSFDIPPVYVVLTCAHLDHDKDNNDPANLRALCQRCHLNWDRERHAEKRRVTMNAKREQRIAATGQMALA